MKNKPFVSVIMPAYNADKYIGNAIESILKQSYNNFEFIIVEDGSTDSTLNIIKNFKNRDKRIILIKNKENEGVTRSLNKALKLSKGKYVIRMDADDWSYPKRFESQIKLMEEHPEVVVSGSYVEVCNDKLKTKYIRRYHCDDVTIRKHLFRYSPFAHPATIWKAAILKRERYDDRVNFCEDYELYFRVGKLGKFMNLSQPLLKLRMHPNSVSVKVSNFQLKTTVLIRFNAVLLHKYYMSPFDKLYNFLQELFVSLIPVKLRFALFNLLRRFEFY